MEKLGQLRAEERWDLIVVDTPPSRSALDFLDAPKRLGSFLDGRFIRILMAPARDRRPGLPQGARGRASGRSPALLTKILGAQVLKDVQTFVAALDTMFGGFRERADATYRAAARPRARRSSWWPRRSGTRCARRRTSWSGSATEQMPLAGLVLNRVHTTGAQGAVRRPRRRGCRDPRRGGRPPAGRPALLRLHAERMRIIEREQSLRGRFTAAHPRVPVVDVPAQPGDVHDLAGLREVGAALGGG